MWRELCAVALFISLRVCAENCLHDFGGLFGRISTMLLLLLLFFSSYVFFLPIVCWISAFTVVVDSADDDDDFAAGVDVVFAVVVQKSAQFSLVCVCVCIFFRLFFGASKSQWQILVI